MVLEFKTAGLELIDLYLDGKPIGYMKIYENFSISISILSSETQTLIPIEALDLISKKGADLLKIYKKCREVMSSLNEKIEK